MTKPFFIGQRSLKIVEPRPNVRALAGFVMHDSTVMPSECHLVVDGDEICGRVTSIARSPTLGHVIGMAYMRPDQTTPGTVIDIRVEGRLVQAEVAKLPFFDPSNERQKS
jgi:sarcosine oxidase subunit alpha